MGMFDYIRCEMPLPDPAPPSGTQFQTKDTPEQYLEPYRITADGRLVFEKRSRVREYEPGAETSSDPLVRLGTLRTVATEDVTLDYHGDIGFGYVDSRTGEDWDYVARFTEGRCVRIWLDEHQPATHKVVEVCVSGNIAPKGLIAALVAGGFLFEPGRDTPDDCMPAGRYEVVRDENAGTVTYRMWIPVNSASGIEARSAETSGSAEGESPVSEAETPDITPKPLA